jgi:hypothetical protein
MNQVIEFKHQSKAAILPVTKPAFTRASALVKVQGAQDGWALSARSATGERNVIRRRRSLGFPTGNLHWLAVAFGSLYLLSVLGLSVAVLVYTFSA